MKLGVVVLNWNGRDVTPRCLDSLFASACPPQRIVVVDNASTDGSADLIRGRYPQVVLIENDSNLGFAEGNNVGIRYLLEREFELVLLLNNDAVVEPRCLCELMRAAETDPAAAYGATIYELKAPGRIWYAGGRISRLTLDARHETGSVGGTTRPTEFVTGCCILFRAEALRSVGLLDRDFFAYYEDVDWCLRARATGNRLVYVPGAVVRHDVSYSFGRLGDTSRGNFHPQWARSRPLVLYLAYRNRLLLARRHAHGKLTFLSLCARRIARGGLHCALLTLLGRASQASAVALGTLDGFQASSRPARIARYLASGPRGGTTA